MRSLRWEVATKSLIGIGALVSGVLVMPWVVPLSDSELLRRGIRDLIAPATSSDIWRNQRQDQRGDGLAAVSSDATVFFTVASACAGGEKSRGS